MINIQENSLNILIDKEQNINKNEKLAIMEILKAAQTKNSKNRKYADEWLILCIILHMRSPVTYRMIRDLKLLPIPCERTIRRYLAQIDCGFDPNFFKVLKEHFANKRGKQLHGVLLLDEMSTRKILLLDQKTMTFKGVADFGDNIPKNIETEMADHALVLVFQPLYEDYYSQPVAVFASHGPTHGDKLATILVQAIILLENAGAKLHGVVSDEGTPNINMWSRMGCSGEKNCFNNSVQHPLEENRKVFFFWDTPHFIKCIRNRLSNKGKLKVHPDEHEIKWEYFKIMHDLDKLQPLSLRLCPKITDVHINIAKLKMMKMRVSLAVQIFSKSVAQGLRYYRTYEQRLKDSESTAQFCCTINNMFDALNRTWKNSSTGFTLGCEDKQILDYSLKWLNAWEEKVETGLLSSSDFLTPQTSEGLRMTLSSMLDLAKYLLEKLKVDVFFTGRVNQDPLEVSIVDSHVELLRSWNL